jgi:hypothetical protein
MEGAKRLKVDSRYSIKFPMGTTVIMTLKSIHVATVPQDVKYIFKDNNGSIIKLTKGVCNRIVIKKYLEALI